MKSPLESSLYPQSDSAQLTVCAKTLTLLSMCLGEYRHIPLRNAIETLAHYWPALFPYGILRPMALDITAQLLADKQARKLTLTNRRLTRCVSVILSSVAYRATLMPGAPRYNIWGQSQSTVMEEEL